MDDVPKLGLCCWFCMFLLSLFILSQFVFVYFLFLCTVFILKIVAVSSQMRQLSGYCVICMFCNLNCSWVLFIFKRFSQHSETFPAERTKQRCSFKILCYLADDELRRECLKCLPVLSNTQKLFDAKTNFISNPKKETMDGLMTTWVLRGPLRQIYSHGDVEQNSGKCVRAGQH